MVFLTLLRDPPFLHGGLRSAREAVGRAGDVLLHPAALLPAVDRQVAGAFGILPPGVQALLLAAGDRRDPARLCRRSADQRPQRRARPDRSGILFPPLPRDPAARFGLRDSGPASEFDQRKRASR